MSELDKNINDKELFWQRLYFDFLKDNAFTFFIYILVVFFIFPTEGVLLPYILGKLFGKMKNNDFNNNFFNIYKNVKELNSGGFMVLIGLVWLIVIIADYGKGEIEAYITPKYLQYIRALFFEGTINLHDSGEFKDIKSGAYIARIMELSRNLRDAFQYTFSKFVPECIVSAIIILYLLYSVPTIGGIMMFQVILSLIIMTTYGSTLMDLIIKKETFFLEEISDNLQNNFNNLMNVFINNETEETVDKNVKLEKKNEELTNQIMNMENRAILSTQLLTVLAYGISLYYLYDGLKSKQITIPLAISIILILGNYLSYVMDLNYGIVHSIIYKMGIVLASKKELEQIFQSIEVNKRDAIFKSNSILFKDISYKYDDTQDKWLFKNFNLSVKHNEKIGIIGRSGSGKTTLVKMLIKLHEPQDGDIEIDNQKLTELSKKSLRSHVNYVNQKTNLFDDTVMYNFKYGNKKTDEEIINILKKYKLDVLFSELADKYETNVGINGGNLSLGMQKITTLIRGIGKDCGVVIFDEPLAGLDKNTRSKVMKMIITECKDKTVLVITHDNEILPYMDRVINLNELQDKGNKNKQEGFQNYRTVF
jgi:ATP-binding cassette, subfamily B, bacterial